MGKEEAEALLSRIGQGHFIGNLPTDMTDESKFHALVTALDTEIGAKKTEAILEESGRRTAEYLLRVRIPGLFQKFLKLLPAGPAFSLLFFAISKNAWTKNEGINKMKMAETGKSESQSPDISHRRRFFSRIGVALFGLTGAAALLAHPGVSYGSTEIPADSKKKCATCLFWGGVRKISKDGKSITADGKGWCNNPKSPAYQKETKPTQGSPEWVKWDALG